MSKCHAKYAQHQGVEFEEDEFGLFTDKSSGKSEPVRRFTWRSPSQVTVQVITYGATITTLKMPDKNGTVSDIVMGFNDINGYLDKLNPYFGATVGRVANRINNARFAIDGITYNVTANLRQHQLHGGLKGFDKVNWDYNVQDGTKVVMSYLSKDGEEGYPGHVLVHVSFELTKDNDFLIDFKASTSKPTYVNLTNHSYFNLAGHNAGAEELYKHVVSINADKYTEVDADAIPSGNLIPVKNTVFDLRIPKVLGLEINKEDLKETQGYDHNFCITKGSNQEEVFVAKVEHPNGRVLEVYSNQPGVQFYTGNFLPDKVNEGESKSPVLRGKEGNYYKHGALCLETQNYPDAINHKNFPPAVLYPGKVYHHTLTYKLSVTK